MTAEHGKSSIHDGDEPHGHDHGDHDPGGDASSHDAGAHDHGPGPSSWWHRVRHVLTPHSHDATDKVDSAMEASKEGIRALWISLVVLGATAGMQAVVVVFSQSVALLGDTLHNVAD